MFQVWQGITGINPENLNFFVSFEIAETFLFILKLSYSKPFHNTLNYVSTANIEKVMKFYNLGDKTNRLA